MNRLTRVFPAIVCLFAAALFVACSDATAPQDPQFAESRGGGRDFTRCSPQRYAQAGAWIDRRGGTLRAGRHVLDVPAGALREATWITMESPAGSLNRVVFGPEGLTFDKRHPAHLVMSYQNCAVSPAEGQGIAYVDESLQIIEVTASDDNRISRTVDAKLLHFSDYVLLSTYAVVY